MTNLRQLIEEYAKARCREHSTSSATQEWYERNWQRHYEHEALMLLLEAFSEEILTLLGKGLPIIGSRRVRAVLSLKESI